MRNRLGYDAHWALGLRTTTCKEMWGVNRGLWFCQGERYYLILCAASDRAEALCLPHLPDPAERLTYQEAWLKRRRKVDVALSSPSLHKTGSQ